MSANREGGQGTQKSGRKPIQEDEQDTQKQGQKRDQGGKGRQDTPEQNRPIGGKENRLSQTNNLKWGCEIKPIALLEQQSQLGEPK